MQDFNLPSSGGHDGLPVIYNKGQGLELLHSYNPDEFSRIFVSGICPKDQQDISPSPPFRNAEPLPIPFRDAYRSSAPLDASVAVIHVFHNAHNPDDFCKGMLIEYQNGGKRALGECRLGVDPVKVYDAPGCICILNEIHRDEGRRRWPSRYRIKSPSVARVSCTADLGHVHHEDGWLCVQFRDRDFTLDMWFSDEQRRVEVDSLE
jgi:hypothetical protein